MIDGAPLALSPAAARGVTLLARATLPFVDPRQDFSLADYVSRSTAARCAAEHIVVGVAVGATPNSAILVPRTFEPAEYTQVNSALPEPLRLPVPPAPLVAWRPEVRWSFPATWFDLLASHNVARVGPAGLLAFLVLARGGIGGSLGRRTSDEPPLAYESTANPLLASIIAHDLQALAPSPYPAYAIFGPSDLYEWAGTTVCDIVEREHQAVSRLWRHLLRVDGLSVHSLSVDKLRSATRRVARRPSPRERAGWFEIKAGAPLPAFRPEGVSTCVDAIFEAWRKTRADR